MSAASILRALSITALVGPTPGFNVQRREPVANDEESVGHTRRQIWVHGYARSGSSTVLSMVSKAYADEPSTDRRFLHWVGKDGSQVSRVFSLFEPCHMADKVDEELSAQGCGGLLTALARCDFKHIQSLHGWTDPHSTTRGVAEYSPELATMACNRADVVAFKTISRAGTIFDMENEGMWVLDAEPELKMIDIARALTAPVFCDLAVDSDVVHLKVRDPRDIYASWLSTWPFNDTNLPSGVDRDVNALLGLCESFARSTQSKHDRVFRVVFERLIEDPMGVMADVFAFMEVPFGDAQRSWVKATFNAQDCPGVDAFIAPYSDCHTNASSSLQKWRSVLNEEEKRGFVGHPACQTVSAVYGYPLL